MTPFLRRVVITREREQDLADLDLYREAYGPLGYTFQTGPFPVLRTAGALRVQAPEVKVPQAPYKPRGQCECGRKAEVPGPQNSGLVCRRCADLAAARQHYPPQPEEGAQLSEPEVWSHVLAWVLGKWEKYGNGGADLWTST